MKSTLDGGERGAQGKGEGKRPAFVQLHDTREEKRPALGAEEQAANGRDAAVARAAEERRAKDKLLLEKAERESVVSLSRALEERLARVNLQQQQMQQMPVRTPSTPRLPPPLPALTPPCSCVRVL